MVRRVVGMVAKYSPLGGLRAPFVLVLPPPLSRPRPRLSPVLQRRAALSGVMDLLSVRSRPGTLSAPQQWARSQPEHNVA